MKSVETKYHGPTHTKGSRISATAEGWGRVIISMPHEYSGPRAHFEAVLALVAKVNARIDAEHPGDPEAARRRHIEPPTVYGGTRSGWVFCFPESAMTQDDAGEWREWPATRRAS